MLLQYVAIHQELVQPHKDNAVLVGVGSNIISLDDYLLERVSDFF